jgi:hypothetical protein
MSIQANAHSIGILLLALIFLVAGYAGWYHLEGKRSFLTPTPGDPFSWDAPVILRRFNTTWKVYLFTPAGMVEQVITGTDVKLYEKYDDRRS